MKKIFCKVAVIAAIFAGGMSAVSCGSDDVLSAISTALSIWQQINQGEQIDFAGNASAYRCTKTSTATNYTIDSNANVSGVSETCSLSVKNSQAAINLGSLKIGNYTLSNISIPSVDYSNDGTTGTFGKEGYGYQVSFNVTNNGTTTSYSTPSGDSLDYPYATASGTLTSEGLLKLTVELYISEDEAFVITYVGNKQTSAQ